ncbi:RsmB/NOP family class I SAM-dependent RNA methyltransferase [Paenibacillus sp. NEAU-GSW1]|uniref:RsmB/NOP family class I SAM-dependent RNA methyltransferase n=1 Tax=Paenibacillus sp. NEAU-GSW1 TaxID=2682486 RepID=UPI0012E29103|nr:RsmB/NOP family class I SAM-dependent RNA methyltransferase [Paenibacillus sp. NEAU-GSW1]MUT66619.1 RNA methyltransferase [Paenibacillus sp. NEAU-GSW1]
MTEVQLPAAFIRQMQALLGMEDAQQFLNSFLAPRAYGLRFNPLKTESVPASAAALEQPFHLTPVPWCNTGYYYDEEARPGKHPYHSAGLYYIQEPSAMSAAELLDAQPGETILDFAAAPGGKTTHIAGCMQGQGLLIANEIHPARAKILSENVERIGIRNAVATNCAPHELSAKFIAFFDRIMLDAPCSGEGMFRKDADAVGEWSEEHVHYCAQRQADILEHAAIMLKPGGKLVYSTCTFNREENETTIEQFVASHPEFSVERTERIWPHLALGEGHFVAVLFKSNEPSNGSFAESTDRDKSKRRDRDKKGSRASSLQAEMELFHSFAKQSLPGFNLQAGEALRFGDALYWLPHDREGRFSAASLDGIKVARAGLHLGDIRKNRLEPAHALAMAVKADTAAWVQSYSADSPEIAAYLRGETLPAEPRLSGWGLVAVDGYPLGWAKASGGQLKNHLPKGLRRFS